jgi:hypothetical protein
VTADRILGKRSATDCGADAGTTIGATGALSFVTAPAGRRPTQAAQCHHDVIVRPQCLRLLR